MTRLRSIRQDPLTAFTRLYEAETPEVAMVRACGALRERAGAVLPPIALSTLTEALGVKVETRPSGPEGRVVWRNGHYVIQLGSSGSWRRQRFTLAHEIAHLLVFAADSGNGRVRPVPTVDRDQWQRIERLCNFGAAELLMPSHDVRTAFRLATPSRKCLRELHDRYLVSWRSLLIRLTEALDGLTVTVWCNRPGRTGRRLRVERSFSRGLDGWLPPGLSEARIRPNLIQDALQHGVAGLDSVHIDFRRGGLNGAMLATSVRGADDGSQELSLFGGHTIPADPWPGDVVSAFACSGDSETYVLMSSAAVAWNASEPVSPASDAPPDRNQPSVLTLW